MFLQNDLDRVVVFLPCRSGSQRVPLKNTRPFAGNEGGLIDIKLRQLIACHRISEIVVSSNDPMVLSIAHNYMSKHGDRIKIDVRPNSLCSSDTSTDELVKYVPGIINYGHILWTHVTSPFFKSNDYDMAIEAYFTALRAKTHLSLMTVTKLQSFIWNLEGPINYDRSIEKWPRTQTLNPLYEVNSAMFLTSAFLMRDRQDRVVDPILFYEVDKTKALDVDWEEDFFLASDVFNLREARS